MIVRDVDDDGKSLFEAVYAVMYYLGHQQETCGFDLIFRLATFLDKADVKAYLHDQVTQWYTFYPLMKKKDIVCKKANCKTLEIR